MTPSAVFGDPRYRTIDEARIIEALVSEGWRHEVAAGQRAAVEHDARAALERSIALGLAYRRSPTGGRLFDPFEASNFLKWGFKAKGERIWQDQFLGAARREIREAHPLTGNGIDTPPDLRALPTQRYAVTVRRSFNLAGRPKGERLRLRLPLPIEDRFLRDASIEPLMPTQIPVDTAIAPARLDVRLTVPEEDEVTIGMRATFAAAAVIPAPGGRLDPTERALYTRPSEGLIKLSPRVRALAAELAGADPDPLTVLRRFWAHLLDELAYGFVHYDAVDPAAPLDWVLEHGWYDCKFGAALIAALCRAQHIPARMITGYLLREISPGFHSWAEVWIAGRGWLPIDVAAWSLSAGGRDADWRDYYFGHLDHRMVVERLPRLFTGPAGIRLPDAWHMHINLAQPGSTVTFEDLATGALAYREHIEVVRLSPMAQGG
jgi:hypothetical protein